MNIDNVISRFVDGLKLLKIFPPFVVMLSLINIKDFKIHLPPVLNQDTSLYNRRINPFKREYILLPNILMENLDTSTLESIDYIFTIVWNAVGLFSEPNFIKEEFSKKRKN